MPSNQKVINMLLDNGSLNGIIDIEDSALVLNGKVYSASRESVNDLVGKEDINKYGVYLLLSEQCVYVGQTKDLAKRTKQHLTDKDWWNKVILMTTKDNNFTRSDIDYLESKLITLSIEVGRSDSDNKKNGNPEKVDKYRKPLLDQYVEEVLFLLELIGVKVFKNNNKVTRRRIRKTTKSTNNKPTLLYDESLAPGVFVKQAFSKLVESGYIFTEEQVSLFCSVEGTQQYTKRTLPLLWLLKDNESHADLEKNTRMRYWKDVFTIGRHRFLLFSQWFKDDCNSGAKKRDFISWYNTL